MLDSIIHYCEYENDHNLKFYRIGLFGMTHNKGFIACIASMVCLYVETNFS